MTTVSDKNERQADDAIADERNGVVAKAAKPPLSLRVRLRKQTANLSRFVHVYLSMISFSVVLFFAATGLTLNHPDWFASQQRTVMTHGMADESLLRGDADKLGLVEMLRSREHVHGAVSEVRVDESQVSVSFRAPGYSADAFIERTTGKYDLTVVASGFVAVVNDLHKGRDAGKTWARLIDASAVMLALVSVSGLVLIWFISKRRVVGLVLAVLATGIVAAIYHWLVP